MPDIWSGHITTGARTVSRRIIASAVRPEASAMQSILHRHNSNAQCTPRKSSSFLSLRREKDAQLPLDAGPFAYDGPNSSSTSPSSYFDVYPKPKTSIISNSLKSRIRRSPSSTQTAGPSHQASPNVYQSHVGDVFAKGPTYTFPTLDLDDDFSTSAALPMAYGYTRTRSRTGPSGKSKWEPVPGVPQLRFSNSSSTQHTETPPRTPDDYTASSESFDLFPVVVAAPVPGVETMDALVDGMNGGSDASSSRRAASRSRFGIPGHHPLYEPPLPTPPPGIVLGGGKSRHSRINRKASLSSESSEDEGTYTSSLSNPPNRNRWRRPRSARSASNSTIIPPSISRITPEENTPDPVNTTHRDHIRAIPHTLPRRSSANAMENHKSMVPSISEIIRNHAPPESQVRSRPSTARSMSLYSPSTHGHATVHEEPEPEPEPHTREEDTEFLSRSSIDSVADEVQRTIRNQTLAKPPPPPPPSSTSAFINRRSIMSDNASSIYSPRSDPGAPSIYSVSAPSSYLPSSPSPLENVAFVSMTKTSPSHAVAQYLRSARLTTLLKLTRSPHASQDNPLTVSLSDLGNPSGYPVVVFLGLGCVRHIMGLYDEMADLMGLRLITIDRYVLAVTGCIMY